MTSLKSLVWLAVAVAVIAAGWILISSDRFPGRLPIALGIFPADWEVCAESPLIIGDSADAFAYVGGALVRSGAGSATVRLSVAKPDGTIRLSVEPLAAAPALALHDGSAAGRHWELASDLDEAIDLWSDARIHGDTGRGDPRLPETAARIAGVSRFDLTVDGDRHPVSLTGFWSMAAALRRPDGSVRQQGLVFSPLLRDKTGFSDPRRAEFTLLLYGDGPGSDVLFQLVFSLVTIERSPSSSDPVR